VLLPSLAAEAALFLPVNAGNAVSRILFESVSESHPDMPHGEALMQFHVAATFSSFN